MSKINQIISEYEAQKAVLLIKQKTHTIHREYTDLRIVNMLIDEINIKILQVECYIPKEEIYTKFERV